MTDDKPKTNKQQNKRLQADGRREIGRWQTTDQKQTNKQTKNRDYRRRPGR